MAQKIDFVSLLHKSQEYISENYAAALSDRSKVVQLRSYIEKYMHDSGFEVEGMTFRELSDRLYSEMAEYSVLTQRNRNLSSKTKVCYQDFKTFFLK